MSNPGPLANLEALKADEERRLKFFLDCARERR